ncbi:thioredoxin-disulfide reductase [bacterium]|nr:thioredoxin-disulfide reductase [bacterium]
MSDKEITRNAVICGSGPAGWTAAIYLARAELKPLVIAGPQVGGQLTTTTTIENFPGFPEGRDGNQLMIDMEEQAKKYGAEVEYESCSGFEKDGDTFIVKYGNTSVRAHTILICTGSSARTLGIETEKTFWNYGVHTCAVCDGGFYRGKEVVIVGGGDSAMEEATYLAKLCTKVTVIHRRDELRASKIMAERALEHPKIEFEWNSTVEEVLGEVEGERKKRVTAVRLRNLKDDSRKELPTSAMFLAIGHTPNSGWLNGQVETGDSGYVVVDARQRTNLDGVFAAGDIHDHHYRQAITAAGYGCKAALEAERYLSQKGVIN